MNEVSFLSDLRDIKHNRKAKLINRINLADFGYKTGLRIEIKKMSGKKVIISNLYELLHVDNYSNSVVDLCFYIPDNKTFDGYILPYNIKKYL